MPDPIDTQRRRLLGTTSALAGASLLNLGLGASARAQGAAPTAPRASGAAAFSGLRQIRAGDLDIGYVDAGPAHGPVAVLLHGWPYDIHSFIDVVPRLTAAGYRVIVPYLRGYGSTRFLSADTARNGEQAVVAVDIIALMD
ncbi:unnamed protein product, partial [marine sediment metagenome]